MNNKIKNFSIVVLGLCAILMMLCYADAFYKEHGLPLFITKNIAENNSSESTGDSNSQSCLVAPDSMESFVAPFYAECIQLTESQKGIVINKSERE